MYSRRRNQFVCNYLNLDALEKTFIILKAPVRRLGAQGGSARILSSLARPRGGARASLPGNRPLVTDKKSPKFLQLRRRIDRAAGLRTGHN